LYGCRALRQDDAVRRLDRHHGRGVRPESAETLTNALESMSAEELRAFVVAALARLDDGSRGDLENALLQHAARGRSGWKPAAPSAALVEEAKGYAAAARRVGEADPSEVDEFLRQAITASLAGDHGVARAVFGALLEPLAQGDTWARTRWWTKSCRRTCTTA
jgi:hypothetical protein